MWVSSRWLTYWYIKVFYKGVAHSLDSLLVGILNGFKGLQSSTEVPDIPYITNSYSTKSSQGDPRKKSWHPPRELIKSTKEYEATENYSLIPHTYTQIYTFPHGLRKNAVPRLSRTYTTVTNRHIAIRPSLILLGIPWTEHGMGYA